MYYAVEGAADRLDVSDVWPHVRSPSQLGRRGRVARDLGDDSEEWTPGPSGRGSPARVGSAVREGKGYGAGEGGLTIRQSQAAMLRHILVCRARRAEFVLSKWDEFAPFFEPPDRDLAEGPLARKLHQLSQAGSCVRACSRVCLRLSLSLSLSHTHTHTHSHSVTVSVTVTVTVTVTVAVNVCVCVSVCLSVYTHMHAHASS